jgi:hypothetical protein
MTLFPIRDFPTTAISPDSASTPIHRLSPDFDFDQGVFKFQPTAEGKEFVLTDTVVSLKNRCIKILATERYNYMIYTPGFGIEFEGIANRNLPRPVEVAMVLQSIQQSIKYDLDVDDVRVVVVDDTTIYDGVTVLIRVFAYGQTFDIQRTIRQAV